AFLLALLAALAVRAISGADSLAR
ncbi:MAG: hypothetical protein QOD52_1940, partial [Gaiellaceae bacterium]|nr:hypothetical protein [Gaiellaceae bacterium]